jgi:uncharacterized protein (TIGR01777 family)
MNILIAGASGFVGRVLINDLSCNHKITVLGRHLDKLESIFAEDINKLTWSNLNNHDATQYELIINLSGANISAHRWSSAVKKELIESRTQSNQQLINWLIGQNGKPRIFCANAIGIYGAKESSNHSLDEDTSLPQSSSDDFLQHIGLVWEQSLNSAIDADIPVTTLRFGVVLKQGSGMLKKLELPFRLGLGSILGSGQQMLSWVHYKDLIGAINFLIAHPDITGAVNITTPYPVTQKQFATELAKILKRPLFIKMPGWLVKVLFGEMGDYLLLKGQNVLPTRLTKRGYKFLYAHLDTALYAEYQNNSNKKV